jgi:lipid kinase YegS
VAAMRIILHGKAAGDAGVRTAVHGLRQGGHPSEVRVTWEPGDATRLTAEAIADAGAGKINCIVAGGGDGTINEVFATAYGAGLPEQCSLGILPLGTANDFAHATGVPVQDPTAALELAVDNRPRWIDVGLLNRKPFINLVSGGFGSRVTVETDPQLKLRLGGLAYVLTGISRFIELSANRGSFRAEGFSWEGPFVALAIGNGRQAGGSVPLCPDALLDDGLLDLMVLPELDHSARLDAFSHLLREGAAAVRAQLVTARSSWIEYESDNDLNVEPRRRTNACKRVSRRVSSARAARACRRQPSHLQRSEVGLTSRLSWHIRRGGILS